MNAPFIHPARILHSPPVVLKERPPCFEGVLTESFARIDWHNESMPGISGAYHIAKGPRGIFWVHDGVDLMAAVEIWRIRRYLYRDMARRRRKLLTSYLGDGKVPLARGVDVINFGANIGEVAIELAAQDCLVYALEPDPNVIPALLLNAKSKPIRVLPIAAWHSDGPLPLYVESEKADTSAINHDGEKTIACGRTIDSILDEAGLDSVHLIVGDAEGGEPEVLQGATEALKRTRYVSVRTGLERRGQSSAGLCRAILEGAGFEILQDENETLIGRNRDELIHAVAI